MKPVPPEFSTVSLQGFLGFPPTSAPTPIALDGDIVLLTGSNGVGKSSLLEAIAFRETGGSCRSNPGLFINRAETSEPKFALRFDCDVRPLESDQKGNVASPPAWWLADEADRRRHLRVVYFHPHYLDRLFEENHGASGASFLDLLAPLPQRVEHLRGALKQATGRVDEQIGHLQREAGLITADEKNQTRRQFAAELNTLATAWREQVPQAVDWLGDFSTERLVIKNGNLRNNWSGELGNLVKQFQQKLGSIGEGITISDLANPADSLQALATLARLTVASAGSATAAEARLTSTLIEALIRLTDAEWAAVRSSAQERHERRFSAELKEKRSVEERDSIRRIRNAMGRGEGDFPRWVADLRKRGGLWRELLRGDRQVVPAPEEFKVWHRKLDTLIESWAGVEGAWAEWAAKLDDREKLLSFELEKIQTENRNWLQLSTMADTIEKLAQQNRRVREILIRADKPADFVDAVTQHASAGAHAVGAEEFANACSRWAQRERDFAEDEERQRDPALVDLQQRLTKLIELGNAITAEAGNSTKSRLGQLQQEVLGKAMKPMEDFLNDAIDRFRVFDTVRPIRLERFAKTADGKRLALRVGRPPRDIAQTSSGQRSQLGLLMFMALHYGMRTTYPSRVICLDEVTSSFDLAQVPRLALLLRQIGYAPLGTEFQRRIFIASHNEDFSQRLAEMLTPPAGRSLRIVRFTGFDPEKGPLLDSFRVQPAQPFDPARIGSYFRFRYGERAHV